MGTICIEPNPNSDDDKPYQKKAINQLINIWTKSFSPSTELPQLVKIKIFWTLQEGSYMFDFSIVLLDLENQDISAANIEDKFVYYFFNNFWNGQIIMLVFGYLMDPSGGRVL